MYCFMKVFSKQSALQFQQYLAQNSWQMRLNALKGGLIFQMLIIPFILFKVGAYLQFFFSLQ